MLVLSKLTNINHASGGSYDPPLFLYSALFAAKGRFGGASPPGGGLWRGCPARRRRGLALLPRPAAGFAGLPRPAAALAGLPRPAAGFGGGCPARRRALARLPRPAAGFCGASLPGGGGVWRCCPARRRGLVGCAARRRGLAQLPRPAAALVGFPVRRRLCAASPHGGGLWRGCPARRRGLARLPRPAFSAGAVHSALGGQLFSPFFAYAPGTRQKHPQNFAGYIAVFHIA